MIPISAGLKAHLAQPYQTMTWCLKVTWVNGTVLGFTALDTALSISGVDYESVPSFMPFDVVSNSDLSVDNSQVDGMLQSPSITIDDLRAGLWDYAQCEFFAVNYQNLALGELVLRVGWLGEVRTGRNAFEAELRGLAQAYTKIIGQLTSPMCRNDLGDAMCQVNMAPFTFSATVTAVANNQTITAAALTQPAPTAPTNISAISKGNPGVVDLAVALPGATAGAPITIFGVTGMTAVNGSTFFRNPSLSNTRFELGVDTTLYPTYTGGGKVVLLGGASGFFDGGLVTFTSGLNNTLGMEVRSYFAVGQFTLQLPMYYTIVVGDTFDITAGCNKFISTCINTYANAINFNGEPYLPGIDQIVQVGKQP